MKEINNKIRKVKVINMKKLLGLVLSMLVVLGMVGCGSTKAEESAKEQERIEQQQEEARIQEEKEQEAIEELREHPPLVGASLIGVGESSRIWNNTVHTGSDCGEFRSRDVVYGYADDERFKDCVLCPKCFENAPSKTLGEIYEY